MDTQEQCDNCESEADFVLEDRTKYCAKCIINQAEYIIKNKVEGIDEFDITELMMNERISREDAIKKLKDKKE